MDEQESTFDIDESLLLRYFNGQLNAEENKRIEDWIQASTGNRKIARDVHYLFFASDTLHRLQTIQPEKALKNVTDRITRGKRHLLLQSLQRIAAILFIPLLLLSGYYFMWGKEKGSVQFIEMSMSPGMIGSVVLPDGSKVWLNSGSYLKYPSAFNTQRREVTLKGEAYFSVSRDESQRFIVHTDNDQVSLEVLGTEFNVDAYENSGFISATLVSGSVRLFYQNAGDETQSLLMNPKDKIVYDCTGKFTDRYKVNTKKEIAWKDGIVILEETPLNEVLWILSKRFNVEFDVRSKKLESSSFTGVFKDQQLERILDHFKIASHINYSIRQDTANGEILKKKVILY